MDLKEQNWRNLCANHLRDWHGIWTRYSPEGEVIESFQSLRSFRSNQDQTEITQTNRYIYANDTTKEESWEYNLRSNGLANGLFHPARNSMRGIFFEQGAATWITTELKTDSGFGIELFFRHEELRHSIGIVYDQSNTLMRTASIQEDSTGFPSKYWSTDLNLLPDRNISGNWQGSSITMTPDLKVSSPVSTQLHFPVAGNETFFFSDGISLSCPGKISIGTDITIAANWLVTPSQLQQLIVKYDNVGAFTSLTLELFHKSDEAEQ
ncbi:DUF3598 family protein [Limnofasciculus baicalensis]|uniref:DUF3598 family protein n=1 Tax=Limnofasciculus baicalensis BBK-W-15 TaxID=2699891 RepID=A0AAE3KP26_9CYAN|nr:DUF3598 family protein [Limnofasciculus baicalensis]MCP2730456.1 DUF3598 family protein [Limnofasciculus baicalensis BBK-W-15]